MAAPSPRFAFIQECKLDTDTAAIIVHLHQLTHMARKSQVALQFTAPVREPRDKPTRADKQTRRRRVCMPECLGHARLVSVISPVFIYSSKCQDPFHVVVY
jgi:hypothetical protein